MALEGLGWEQGSQLGGDCHTPVRGDGVLDQSGNGGGVRGGRSLNVSKTESERLAGELGVSVREREE